MRDNIATRKLLEAAYDLGKDARVHQVNGRLHRELTVKSVGQNT